jgi:hypothetical protein
MIEMTITEMNALIIKMISNALLIIFFFIKKIIMHIFMMIRMLIFGAHICVK